MTQQEQQLISGLAERIRNAPAPQIDRDAYDLILHTIGTRPDALYILTQTILIQEIALSQAKAKIEELKGHVGAAQQGGFLPQQGGGWGQDSRVQQPTGYQASPYQQSGYQNSSYAAPPPPPPSGGGFSNFLRNAATTAAGVVAGEIAFDSLSSLFGHRGGFFGGGGGGFFDGGGISPGSETIVNNYYGDERDHFVDPGDGDSRFAQVAEQDQDISPDIEDERDSSGDSFDSGGDSGGDDNSSDS